MTSTDPNGLNSEELAERSKILAYRVLEWKTERVWRRFEEAGFRPILIKGWAAAQLYPEPYRREFVDVDLLIPPERYQEAIKFSATLNENVAIDLHNGARHLDSLTFEDLFSNAVKQKCGQTELRVLRPEDHLRILCVHWLNDGGAKRERLWDIYYSIANRPDAFDWDRALEVVSKKRRKWIVCAVGLAHKYLGLEVENTPISDEAKKLPAWLVKAALLVRKTLPKNFLPAGRNDRYGPTAAAAGSRGRRS